MKVEKNNNFFKKSNFLFFKIFLWIGIGLVFTTISLIIPTVPNNNWQEIVVFLCLLLVINIHTSYLYPKFSKKSKWGYLVLIFCSILFCTGFEMFVFYKNFDTVYYDSLVKNKLYVLSAGYIVIRNLAIFCFFLWVEYFNRLILLFYKKEKIHKEEILLLYEKQEFEKTFSRAKLLPHYFFNILENVFSKSTLNFDNRGLLDKIKFILYYFLVDAEKEKIDLEKELEFYKCYIELENLRHNNKISVRFETFGQTEALKIITLIFEPLIGNAMKYTKHDGTGWVEIIIDATQLPVLFFHCKNNFSKQTANIVSSENGLKILEQRLKLCYKNNYTYKVIQSSDIYDVALSIKLF